VVNKLLQWLLVVTFNVPLWIWGINSTRTTRLVFCLTLFSTLC